MCSYLVFIREFLSFLLISWYYKQPLFDMKYSGYNNVLPISSTIFLLLFPPNIGYPVLQVVMLSSSEDQIDAY